MAPAFFLIYESSAETRHGEQALDAAEKRLTQRGGHGIKPLRKFPLQLR